MHRLVGSYLRFLHDSRNHLLIEVRIATWLSFALLLLAAFAMLGGGFGGRAIGVVFLAIFLTLTISDRIARRRNYVHFVPRPFTESEQPQQPLWSEDKILHRATGYFWAETDESSLTNLLAYYRTFETREHAIMARKTPTSFLGLGLPDTSQLHMWYLFCAPNDLKNVDPGELYFGPDPRPALRIDFKRYEQRGAKQIPVASTAYLSFESESDCHRVYEDLALDLGGPPRRPWRKPVEDRAT
ncbi:MAG: hypothetical protein J5I90_12215 [Caldilineales bacterium]|nr:hypothetical protein [Caldilineales bacterium]